MVDDLPFSRPDTMIPGGKEMGIMMCEFETPEGARRAAKIALMAYTGPDIGLRLTDPTENTMLMEVFERANNRPYTETVRAAGKTYEPTLETQDGVKVWPRFSLGERSEPRALFFTGGNSLNPKAGKQDLWVAHMDGSVFVPKIKI